MAKCTLFSGNDNQECAAEAKAWKEYVGLRPELVAAARAVPPNPSQRDIDLFRIAVAASHAKREQDDSAEFRVMSRDVAREVLLAYTLGAKVVDLDSRRETARLRAFGLEVPFVSIDSVMPPPSKR